MSKVSQGTAVCTEYARTLIRVKARQIVRRPGFSRSDTDDVEQDLFLHLLNQIQQFDPSRGSLNTFIARVVDSAVAMLIRQRRRGKRTPETGVVIQSLEVMDQQGGPPAPLGTTLSQADAERRTGGDSMSGIELFDLADDLAHLIDALPPDLQAVCRARMDRNRKETERDLGLSRRNYDAAMELIREHFAQGGFGEI
jgi:RNA polymerase sigma-70 factor (ECF subfamily)